MKFYKINKVNKDIEVHLKITAAHLGSVQVSGCYLDHENKMTNRREVVNQRYRSFSFD